MREKHDCNRFFVKKYVASMCESRLSVVFLRHGALVDIIDRVGMVCVR